MISTTLVCVLVLGSLRAEEANADVIPVNDLKDVVERASEHGGDSRTYSCASITYGSKAPTANLLLFAYREVVAGYVPLIGGLENAWPMMPDYGGGFINKDDATFWGLDFGDVLGGNVAGGFFAGVDLNGDGDVGTYNTGTGQLTFDVDEYFEPSLVQFTGFSPFPLSGKGTIASINIIPEPATVTLLALGGLDLLLRRRKRQRKP